MIYLSGHVSEDLAGPGVGFILTPKIGAQKDLSRTAWAADNNCFGQGKRFRLDRFLGWLRTVKLFQPTCLFVVAPDVVADARATWARSEPVFPLLRSEGWPVALVAQNGLADMLLGFSLAQVNAFWDSFDCLFVGGTTEYKVSEEARLLCYEAKKRGKWTHMGRVNSAKRYAIAADFLCDSVDGTSAVYLRRAYTHTEIKEMYHDWLDRADTQPSLFRKEL